MENSFKVSGYVGYSEVTEFKTASLCRFSLSVSRKEKDNDNWTSAFLNAQAWAKNEDASKFSILSKGNLVTVEGYFKPEEWTDKDNVNHNTIKLVATKFSEFKEEEKPNETPAEKPAEEKNKKAKK